MGSTLDYIANKFKLDIYQKSPITILETNRTVMAQTLYELGYTVGAEIGVAKGDHALILCENNPNLRLYCVDIWETYKGYREYTDRITKYYRVAQEILSPYDCVFVKKFSMDAVKDFADESLDFVYIDGAHDFKNVADDLCEWSKKVRPGGIVYGHDFKRSVGNYQNAVKDIVPAYCYQFNIKPWFILGTQGKRDGTPYKEGTQSWMFVKDENAY
jgi:predicted O-methyltransferase YrrM